MELICRQALSARFHPLCSTLLKQNIFLFVGNQCILFFVQTLLKWMNDVLEPRRIILRDIVEDLYDGQIISELVGTWGRTCVP